MKRRLLSDPAPRPLRPGVKIKRRRRYRRVVRKVAKGAEAAAPTPPARKRTTVTRWRGSRRVSK
jgi:hypothetical protein